MGKTQHGPGNRGKLSAKSAVTPSEADTANALAWIPDANEHLTRDLARVRAKFAMDQPPGIPSLTAAWMSEAPLEGDEAEFVDTVADCLGAGISLQDALTCWDTGDLAADGATDADATAADDEPTTAIIPITRRRPTRGHRLFVR